MLKYREQFNISCNFIYAEEEMFENNVYISKKWKNWRGIENLLAKRSKKVKFLGRIE